MAMTPAKNSLPLSSGPVKLLLRNNEIFAEILSFEGTNGDWKAHITKIIPSATKPIPTVASI
jgi:hypothetical protein